MAINVNLKLLHLEQKSMSQLEATHSKFAMLKVRANSGDKAILDEVLKACEAAAGKLLEASANVEDKIEHGHDPESMIRSFAATAGCSADALRQTIYERQTFTD